MLTVGYNNQQILIPASHLFVLIPNQLASSPTLSVPSSFAPFTNTSILPNSVDPSTPLLPAQTPHQITNQHQEPPTHSKPQNVLNQVKAQTWNTFTELTKNVGQISPQISEIQPAAASKVFPSAIQCGAGQFNLYDYRTKLNQCFKLKGWSPDLSPEVKKQKLEENYRMQLKESYRIFEEFKTQINSYFQQHQSLSKSLIDKALHLKTTERAAIRLGTELLMHLQLMDIECQQLPTRNEVPYSFCMLDQGMWRVSGSNDTLTSIQDSHFTWIQKQMQFWNDIYSRLQSKSIVKQEMNAIDNMLLEESEVWVKIVEFICQELKEKENNFYEIHKYVNRAVTLFEDTATSKRSDEATTHLSLGLSLLDQTSNKLKEDIQYFYFNLSKKDLWSIDLLTVWTLTGYICSSYLAYPPSSFLNKKETWNTLLTARPYLLKTQLTPLFSYFFLSWSLLADPIILPTQSSEWEKKSKTIQEQNRFGPGPFVSAEQYQGEQETNPWALPKQIDPVPFMLLSFIPCDLRLTAHLSKLPTPELSKINLHIYQFRWNEFAFKHFGLQGEAKQLLGHELESILPGSVKHVKDFLCLRVGILKFYLDYIVPFKLKYPKISS